MTPKLMALVESIFTWAFARDISLSAEHLPGVDNVIADRLSRDTSYDKEWQLLPALFDQLCARFGAPEVDLFATRINFLLQRYVSWRPDPCAWKIDAFTFAWPAGVLYYAFPPFSLVGSVLRKVEQDGALVMLVAPMWATQVWFPKLLHLLVDVPVLLPNNCVPLPQDPSASHPLGSRLGLAGMIISGDPLLRREFRQGLEPFYAHPGGRERRFNTDGISIGGSTFVSGDRLIRFGRLCRS